MAEAVKEPEVKEPTEREKLYQEYEKTVAPPAEEKKDEVPVQPPVEAEAVKEEKKEEVKQPEAPDWKAATYEERQKRKAEAELRKAAEAREKVLADKIKLYESQKEIPVDEPIVDYDKTIIEIKKELRETKNELRAIKETETERAEREKKEAFDKVQQGVVDRFEKMRSSLIDRGYYGITKYEVQEELQKLVAEDENNVILDNPAGWEKIAIEVIFPRKQAEVQEAEKKRALTEKTELKKNANLSSNSGKIPPKPKDVNDKSEAEVRSEYLEALRKSRGLG